MGLLKHLLFWPVTGPMFLTEFSLGRVQGVVKEELTDDARIKEALLDLQLRMELGEIDEEEYIREEARLLTELREVRRWREEFGMATRGGVVQVGDAAPPPGGAPTAGSPDADSESGEGGRDAVEDEEPPASPTVPRGATLEVTLDWDEEEDEEDGPWPEPEGSPDDSEPGTSSS